MMWLIRFNGPLVDYSHIEFDIAKTTDAILKLIYMPRIVRDIFEQSPLLAHLNKKKGRNR